MNKKSQMYIIIAVLLISMAFGTVLSTKSTVKPEKEFTELWKNYVKEAPFAANQGKFEDFTQKFAEFAKARDKNFRFISIYSSQSGVYVYNAYGKTININNQLPLQDNEAGSINRTGKVAVITDEDIYYFSAPAGSIKAIFKTESKTAKRVYVYE